jgi:hypothetical protein
MGSCRLYAWDCAPQFLTGATRSVGLLCSHVERGNKSERANTLRFLIPTGLNVRAVDQPGLIH